MFITNFLVIHPTVVETFHGGTIGKSQGITKVIRIHRPGTTHMCTKFGGSPLVVVEID